MSPNARCERVLDPTKVVPPPLTDAGSIWSMILTTEALVPEVPEEKSAIRHPSGRHCAASVPYAGAAGSRCVEGRAGGRTNEAPSFDQAIPSVKSWTNI